MEILSIFRNEIFTATLSSTVLAQIVKTSFDYWSTKKFHWQSLFRGAGMPSSHTATVLALTLSVYLSQGVSDIFVVTLVFAAIVVRDVIGDKVFATHQENIINKLVQQMLQHEKVQWNHLIGHTITEVVVGAILAVLVTCTVYFLL